MFPEERLERFHSLLSKQPVSIRIIIVVDIRIVVNIIIIVVVVVIVDRCYST